MRRNQDTDLDGPQAAFPATRGSVVRAADGAAPPARRQAFEALVAAYWKPVYKYVRLRWTAASEDAKDLTQGFFIRVLEKDLCARYDPSRSRFRTYPRVCVDSYVANEHTAAGRSAAAATIATRTVTGRRSAKSMGFMR